MTTSQRTEDQHEHFFTNLEGMADLSPELPGCTGEIPIDDEIVSIEAEAIAFEAELEVEWVFPRLA
jgi:hypothetical protein